MTQTLPSSSSPSQPAGGKGLEGVVAANSEICFIDGIAGRLVYRGYEIGDLVENTTFEETAFLLWEGRLPNKTELADLKKQLGQSMSLPKHAHAIIAAMPKDALPMDVLRTVTSALGIGDPDLMSNEPDANRRKAIRLTAQFPTIVGEFQRQRSGQPRLEPDPNLSIAGNFLYML